MSYSVTEKTKNIAGRKVTGLTLLLFLPFRTFLILFGQALFALYYYSVGVHSPWVSAGKWWTIWGNVADIGCLAVLFLVMRQKNLRIVDLFGPPHRRTLLTGIIFFLIIAPISAIGYFLGSYAVYGTWHAILAPGELYERQLPVWAIFYSLIIWAPVWSVTEELTYNGFLTPEIDAFFGRHWVTLTLIGFWWALQHSFLPLILDWHYIIWRFLVFVPCVLALNIVYLRTKKLSSLIIAHFIMDMIAAATTLSYSHFR